LERLRLIKQLLDSGIRPGKLARLDLQQLRQMTLQLKEVKTVPADVEPLLEILASGPRTALRMHLEALLQQHGLRSFLTTVVAPMNHAVGEAWFAGRIGVLDEHHYAEQVHMILLTALHNLPQPKEGDCSIVGISCSDYMNRRAVATQLIRLRNLLPETIAVWAGGNGIRGIRPCHPAYNSSVASIRLQHH
ncbi:hypothetical protein JZU71_01500, partial [bacterium]|nr:hypothetical protein [bacterium]